MTEEESDIDWPLNIKFISIPSLFLLCFIFGIFPYIIEKCRMNEAFLSAANTFSGGLFFGIGQFHLLAEGVEKMSKYSELPLAFFLAAVGYSFILFIQKVVFGHIMMEQEQNEGYGKDNKSEDNESDDKIYSKTKKKKEKKEEEEEEKNEEEEEKKDDEEDKEQKTTPLLNHSSDDSVVMDVNSSRVTMSEIGEKIKEHLKQKKLSAFIILLALSIHGLFECTALGIQTEFKNTLFLFIALMIHKWAEAFALGVFFIQAKMTKKMFYLLITLFALIGPVGVGIGIALAETASELVEGVFLSISTGTFLYVACSEVIVEEFSTPKKRYFKFFLYFLGCVFAAGLAMLEYI